MLGKGILCMQCLPQDSCRHAGRPHLWIHLYQAIVEGSCSIVDDQGTIHTKRAHGGAAAVSYGDMHLCRHVCSSMQTLDLLM